MTAAVALAARSLVAALAWGHFPPADDGVLYDRLARRIADGFGYTWAWPDGTVTPVAHYPVGYPALLAATYRLFGPSMGSALLLHVLIGTLGAVCVHVVAADGVSPRAARWAGLAVALHPALLSYVPALMTEGVCAGLLAVPLALAVVAKRTDVRWKRASLVQGAGASLGLVVLVRPQTLLLSPLVAWLSTGPGRARRTAFVMSAGLVVLGLAVVVAPWTLRNERVLGRPVLVSANSGWNLLIGTDAEAAGTWRPLAVPDACKEVWDEGAKDACFGAVARGRIAEHPWAWIRRMPSKLGQTFDLAGSGLSYLARSRGDLVPRWAVLVQGVVEVLFERGCLLVVLLAEARSRRRRSGGAWLALMAVGVVSLATPYAWVAYVAATLLLTRTEVDGERSLLRLITCGVLGATALVHVVYFGASRYGLLVQPWVAGLAGASAVRGPQRPPV